MKLYKKGYSSSLQFRQALLLKSNKLTQSTGSQNCYGQKLTALKDWDLRDFLVKVRVKADNLTTSFEIVLRLLTKRVVMTMKE